MLTKEQFREIVSLFGTNIYTNEHYIYFNEANGREIQIKNKAELAAFLAHVLHDTEGFTRFAQQNYKDEYYGRGYLHFAGKEIYRFISKSMNIKESRLFEMEDAGFANRSMLLAWKVALRYWKIKICQFQFKFNCFDDITGNLQKPFSDSAYTIDEKQSSRYSTYLKIFQILNIVNQSPMIKEL